MSRQNSDADLSSNDRNEIYDRRDKKKRRDWRDKRHHDNRRVSKEVSKPTTRDSYDDDEDSY